MKKKIFYKKIITIIFLSIIFLSTNINAENLSNKEDNLETNYNFTNEIYVVPYMGDIDGSTSITNFYFYNQLIEFHTRNNIPLSASFYPATLKDDKDFNQVFMKMYNHKEIEIIQKGYRGDDKEAMMSSLSANEQKEIIQNGQNAYSKYIEKVYGINNPKTPKAYNQYQGSFSQETAEIASSLGIDIYFDVFIDENHKQVQNTHEFVSIQYGVSFVEDSRYSGLSTQFKEKSKILDELNDYKRDDINITYINNKPVVPLWAHQQDFYTQDNLVNQDKWETYTYVLKSLKQNPNVEIILPSDIFDKIIGSNNENNDLKIEIPNEIPQNILNNINSFETIKRPISNNSYINYHRNITKQEASLICSEFSYPFINSTLNLGNLCEWINQNIPFINNLQTNQFNVEDTQQSKFLIYYYDKTLKDSTILMEVNNPDIINNISFENPNNNKKIDLEYTINDKYLYSNLPENKGTKKIKFEIDINKTLDNKDPFLIGRNVNLEDKENI